MRGGADGRRAGLAALGGTLVEEFPAVRRTTSCGKRFLDAAILLNKKTYTAHWRDVSLKGEDMIVVQAKAMRLGMYLMGRRSSRLYSSSVLALHEFDR